MVILPVLKALVFDAPVETVTDPEVPEVVTVPVERVTFPVLEDVLLAVLIAKAEAVVSPD
jgi:hypothetical protein